MGAAARRRERAVADVIVLFAREDVERARSVEAALAGSGFAVEAQQFELQAGPLQAPAVVALWSRAMAASRAAISLAQSLLAEKRLVSARLDINVPASLFNGHAMHDLVRWGGDPDDPVLDGLIAEADRCVLEARLAPKPVAAPPPAPPRQAAPAPRAEPPPEPVRVQQVAGGGARPVPARAPANDLEPVAALDPAAEEAKLWKAIRNSTNRADFESYLARYGQDGLFAELALAKLETLPKPGPSPQRPQAPQPPGGSLPIARFADSWRFGADWSTRAEPPRQRDGMLAPRPSAPAPAPAPAAPVRTPVSAPPADQPMRRAAAAPTPRPQPASAPAASAPQPAPAAPRAAAPQHPSYLRIPNNPHPPPAPEPPAAAPQRPAAAAPPAAFDRELADAPWDRVRVAPAPAQTMPAQPSAERLPAARSRRKKRGGRGGAIVVFLLLAGAAGAAYYFMLERPELLQRGSDQAAVDWPLTEPELETPPELGAAAEPSSEAPLPFEATAPETRPTQEAPSREVAAPPRPRTELPPPRSDDAPYRPPASANQAGDSLSAASQALRGEAQRLPPSTSQPAPVESRSDATSSAPSAVLGPAAEPARPAFSYGRPVEPATAAPTTPAPAASLAAPAQRPAPPRGKLSWARRPSPETIAGLYPREAERRGVEGRATLRCTVLVGGDLSCRTVAETPAGMGFGQAALQAAKRYRAETLLSDGSSAVGSETQIDIVFKP